MSTPYPNNDGRQATRTELEIEAGRKAIGRHAQRISGPNSTNDAAPVCPCPRSSGKTTDPGIGAGAMAKRAPAEGGEMQPTDQPGPSAGHAEQSDTSPALDFLDDFFGSDKRHLDQQSTEAAA